VKPAELAKGYARVEAEFQKALAGTAAKCSLKKAPQITPWEAAQAAQGALNAVRKDVLQMLSEVMGLSDEDDRQLIPADDLARRARSLQYRVLVDPKVKLPAGCTSRRSWVAARTRSTGVQWSGLNGS
jgi:hypothetical protein